MPTTPSRKASASLCLSSPGTQGTPWNPLWGLSSLLLSLYGPEWDLPPDTLPCPQSTRNPTFPKLPFPRTMRKLKSEMCRRPGLAPKKQRLESVGLGDGEGMGEEEGPIRTRCEKGERSRGSQIPSNGVTLRETASKNERGGERRREN